MQQISVATREQNIGAEQINDAIRELDGAIREIADAASDSTSTSRHLADQSSDLLRTVEFFSLKHPAPEAGTRDTNLDAGDQTAVPRSARDAA